MKTRSLQFIVLTLSLLLFSKASAAYLNSCTVKDYSNDESVYSVPWSTLDVSGTCTPPANTVRTDVTVLLDDGGSASIDGSVIYQADPTCEIKSASGNVNLSPGQSYNVNIHVINCGLAGLGGRVTLDFYGPDYGYQYQYEYQYEYQYPYQYQTPGVYVTPTVYPTPYPTPTVYPTPYPYPTPTFSVSATRSVGGRVVSSPPGIDCGSTCSSDFPANTEVTFRAYPRSSYWKFDGWSGDCTNSSGPCILNINSDKRITPSFILRLFDYREF